MNYIINSSGIYDVNSYNLIPNNATILSDRQTDRQTTSFNDFSIEAGILLRGNGVPHAMLVIHIRA